MIIRTATIDDLPQIAAVESECFPPAEAATKEEFADRLIHYANHFWLMFDEQNDNIWLRSSMVLSPTNQI